MIICSNCGATNNESDGRICRKCGALLPVGNKPPRIRVSFGNNESTQITAEKPPQPQPSEEQTTQNKNVGPRVGEVQFFSPNNVKKEEKKSIPAQLEEIPKPASSEPQKSLEEEPKSKIEEKNLSNIPRNLDEMPHSKSKSGLPEIKPIPYQGPIVPKNGIKTPQTQREQKSTPRDLEPIPEITRSFSGDSEVKAVSQPEKPQSRDTSTQSFRHRLEDEMSGLLSELSKEIATSSTQFTEPSTKETAPPEEKTLPSSMNDILKEVLSLDTHIRAAALMQYDGTILASALSSRITEGLFSTIGRTLSIIGTDIVNGLNAGKLKSISMRGTQGLLNLAPIELNSNKVADMILIMFSSARVKSGIVNIASGMVKKQVKEYIKLKYEE